jgi:hypothetical protein
MIRNLNAENTFYEYRLQSFFPPFLDFGIEIGEFAYQLRSMLDQIIYALSVFPDNLTAAELHQVEKHSSFPILHERRDSWLKSQLQYIPDSIRAEVWEIVDGEQPYQAGDRAEYDFLGILEEVSIRDKHRVLKPSTNLIHFNGANLTEGVEIMVAGNVKHGDVFARVRADLDPEEEFEKRVTSEIKIEIARPKEGVGITVLGSIYGRACLRIFPKFEGFFERLPETVRKMLDEATKRHQQPTS